MERIFTSAQQLIGNTPLVELSRLAARYGVKARLLAKVEFLNPGGSVKDRVALRMLDEAEQMGLLHPGSVVIEPTSGNTGIGLCAISAARGYRCIIVMPDTMSRERQLLMKAYGAEVVLSPGAEGMAGAIRMANALAEQNPGSFIPGQFNNPANPAAHVATTGPEIWRDTDGKMDIFVAGAGTGGTVTGVGRYLKQQNADVQIIAAEPAASPVLSGGKPGKHGIQGIGAGFIPSILDLSVIDEVIRVEDADAFRMARELARTEGLLAGISSGCALWAAMEAAKRPENKGKTIVALLPDSGERYLSTGLYE